MADVAELSFEAALQELEQVVGRLESGDVPLEESISLYARGAELRGHCEAKLKADLKVTIRNLPFDRQADCVGGCCLCGAPAKHRAIFARSY